MKENFQIPYYEGKITLILKQGRGMFPERKPEIVLGVNIEAKIFGRKIVMQYHL